MSNTSAVESRYFLFLISVKITVFCIKIDSLSLLTVVLIVSQIVPTNIDLF